MAGSPAEREIRDYTAARLRQLLPGSRIIHELVVGGCRADLAAIQSERVTLIEIKSERDTLKRLPQQLKHFSRAAHEIIVVAHGRWFDTAPYDNGLPRFVPGEELCKSMNGYYCEMWAYPEVPERKMYGAWSTQRYWSEQAEPRASELLGLLWKQELLQEAFRHRIAAHHRDNMCRIIREMVWNMTGKEIARAVCRQLRGREFPEADAPIIETKAVA